jgi:hypothetical protein
MLKTKFIQGITVVLGILTLASCDKDFNSIGADIVGDDHFLLDKYSDATVKSYMQATGPVQSNNLTVNPLGIYDNPIFGKTTAHFVTQVTLGSKPTFTTINQAPQIKSVKLYIPYFSKKQSTNENGDATYKLDSIYGTSKIKLSIFENKYILRGLDPATGFTEAQKYYTDQNNDIESNRGTVLINDAPEANQNSEFIFSNAEIKETETDEDGEVTTTRKAPGMYLDLNKSFFTSKILGASSSVLESTELFGNWFRGLYFKVEQADTEPNGSSLMMLNFAGGVITIEYEEDASSGGVVSRIEKKLELNLTGNTVSLQQHTNSSLYQNALSATPGNITSDRLFVKGGVGSIAIIDLFDRDVNGESSELEQIRQNNWMINEANLVFYVDREGMADTRAVEPQRIYLYDVQNNRPLIDYYLDATVFSSNTKLNKYIHGGLLEKEDVDNGRGIKYKIRITKHIANLVKQDRDSTNVRLGLVVTDNVNLITSAKLKNTTTTNAINKVPTASVFSPFGTILYGSGPTVPEEKRLKLEIYYTKPN